jgi:hypothetical protein
LLQPPTSHQPQASTFTQSNSNLGPQTPAFLLPVSVLQPHRPSTEIVAFKDFEDTSRSIYFFKHKNPRQFQGDLFKLRSSRSHQPEKGPFPKVLMDPSWSQPKEQVPIDANIVIYIPSSTDGDIVGLIEPRPENTNQEEPHQNNILGPVELSAKKIYWAVFDGNLSDLARQGDMVQSKQTIQVPDPTPPFTDIIVEYKPQDPRYKAWLDAAMNWWNEYEVPREELIWCHCREVEGNRRLIECSSGSMRCPHVWYHLDCFGKGDDYPVPKQGDWFCPTCRENHPDLTGHGFLLSESEPESEVIEVGHLNQAGEVVKADEDMEMNDVDNSEPSSVGNINLLPELSDDNLFGVYLSDDDRTV